MGVEIVFLPDGLFDVVAQVDRQPAIYIDNDSLSELAKHSALGDRFLACLQHCGTLLFSMSNAVDLAGPQGRSADVVRDFLDRVGSRWAPFEFNAFRLARREVGQESHEGSPAASPVLIHALVLQQLEDAGTAIVGVGSELLRLGRIVEYVQRDRTAVMQDMQRLKDAAAALVSDSRQKFLQDPGALDRLYPPMSFSPATPAMYVLNETLRIVTRQARSHTWSTNDGIDMAHAVSAVAYADLILLDRQWKERMQMVHLPLGSAEIFYRFEIDQFLSRFEAWVAYGCNRP